MFRMYKKRIELRALIKDTPELKKIAEKRSKELNHMIYLTLLRQCNLLQDIL